MTHSVLSADVANLPDIPSETDRIDPVSDIVLLKSGMQARVVPIRMRQLFRLLRIVTRGGSQYIPLLRDAWMSSKDSENAAEEFGTQLLAVVLIALPEAEDEAVEFVQSVVEPLALLQRNDKQAREHNDGLHVALAAELNNPHPDDVVTILEAIVSNNKDDLVALGKRLGAMMSLALKTGQVPNLQPSQGSSEPTQTSSDHSPEPLTSSVLSTDGLMTSSSNSPYDG